MRVEKLTIEVAGHQLLSDISFGMDDQDKSALIGPNGSGKSRLLEHIFLNHNKSQGQIKTAPGIKIAYVRQENDAQSGTSLWQYAKTALTGIIELEKQLRELEQNLSTGQLLDEYARLTTRYESLDGYNAEHNLKKNLSAFGFSKKSYLNSLSTLSGGQRARLKLAMVLSADADLLLLDEPGNHLDIEMRQYLKTRLQKMNAAILLVSHDRDLVNGVVEVVLELNAGSLTKYKGNYDSYKSQKRQKMLSAVKQQKEVNKRYKKLKKQERKLKKITSTKAEAAKRRMRRELAGLEPKRIRREKQELEINSDNKKQLLLKVSGFTKSYREKTVLDNISLSLNTGDKIAIVGKNASGKSTLFKMIAGLLESDNPKREIYFANDAKLLYIDQNLRGLDIKTTIVNHLSSYVSRQRAEMLLSLVKIPYEDWQKLPPMLSGGQRMRAAIALIIASEANILLLDEPTNDLDIEMIEILENSLVKSKTAVLFASHDARFIRAVGDQVWSLQNGKLLRYQAGLKGYFAKRIQIEDAVLLPETQVGNIEEDIQEKYELELRELDEKLLDPLHFSGRELYRFKERSSYLINELSVIYDAAQPEPLARYQLKHLGVELYADKLSSGIIMQTNASVDTKLIEKDKVGHLILKETGDNHLLPWARDILIDLTIDMSFLYLDLELLQFFYKGDLSETKFAIRNNGWWIISRHRYEESKAYFN